MWCSPKWVHQRGEHVRRVLFFIGVAVLLLTLEDNRTERVDLEHLHGVFRRRFGRAVHVTDLCVLFFELHKLALEIDGQSYDFRCYGVLVAVVGHRGVVVATPLVAETRDAGDAGFEDVPRKVDELRDVGC